MDLLIHMNRGSHLLRPPPQINWINSVSWLHQQLQ